MRRLIAAAVVAAPAALLAAPAAAAPEGWYAGGSLGRTAVDNDRTLGGNFDANDWGWKVFGGYRDLGPDWLAVEAGYINFGRPAQTIGTQRFNARVRGVQLSGLALLPFDQWDVFARLGIARLDSRITSANFRLDRGDTRWVYGLGGQYRFDDRLAVRAEWERYRVPGGNPHMYSIGASWSFGGRF